MGSVILAIMGVIAIYATILDTAQREMALRQGPPPVVAVQDFLAREDVAYAGEIHIRARAEIEEMKVIEIVEGSGRERFAVVPLFASGGVRESGEMRLMASLVHPLTEEGALPRDIGALVERQVNVGSGTPLVEVNGRLDCSPGLRAAIVGDFGASGLTVPESALCLRTFAGQRDSILSVPARNSLAALFLTGSVALFAAAGAFAFREPSPHRLDDHADELGEAMPVVQDPRFAPLPSQEEMARRELLADRQAAWAIVTKVKGLLSPAIREGGSWLFEVVQSSSGAIRNRR